MSLRGVTPSLLLTKILLIVYSGITKIRIRNRLMPIFSNDIITSYIEGVAIKLRSKVD